MLKRLLTSATLSCFCAVVLGQTQNLGEPLSWTGKIAGPKRTVEIPQIDNAAELQAEMTRRANTAEKMYRFGAERDVNVNVMQESDLRTLPNGNVVRLLEISSPGALSINLIFGQFELAKGARLYISAADKSDFIGAHTFLNNNSQKQLGTDLIYTDKVVIELMEPASVAGTSTLVLTKVVHGFLNLEEEVKALNSSGSCEYDVNCPVGAGWENQRNAVAMLVNGGGFCTGSLINNTSGTIIPYFLTADHCGSSPASWVYRFRWERPSSTVSCGSNTTNVNGPQTMNVNGGITRASSAASDFHLIELNSAPDPLWDIYYNGWNRTDVPSNGGIGIHHPAGDIKKISFDYSLLESTTFGSCPPNSHWKCPTWDIGVTEGGSSGSPLFDVNHRTIGQLHGGASACGASDLSDEYGKIYTSWEGGGTPSTRLKDWLDPSNSGVDFIDGVNPAAPSAVNDAGMGAVTGASGLLCAASTVTPTVTITNGGSATLTSATILYHIDAQPDQTYNWTGSLAQYASATIPLPAMAVANGAHTFSATISNPNGSTDEVNTNNTVSSSFTVVTNPVYADLTMVLDCWGSETSWKLQPQSSTDILYSGGGYSNNSAGQTINQSFCLSAGCYTFTIDDDYGDGFGGDNGCDDGYYYIVNADDDTVAQIAQVDADFGSSDVQSFCLTPSGLGMSEVISHQWSVFPNPAKESVTIDLAELTGAQVLVNTITGELVNSLENVHGTVQLTTSGYAKGVYIISVITAEGVSTKRLIVQ